MSARNKVAYARGQAIRAEIRAYLLEHARRHPLGRGLTAWEIQAHLRPLGVHLATSTIYWHLEQIRSETDDEPLEGRNFSNSSTAGEAAR